MRALRQKGNCSDVTAANSRTEVYHGKAVITLPTLMNNNGTKHPNVQNIAYVQHRKLYRVFISAV